MPKTKNRRTEPRRTRKHEAWIVTEDGRRHCMVINISTEGATLSLKEPLPLPKQFRLAFTLNTRQFKNCELVWRRGMTAGVNFKK